MKKKCRMIIACPEKSADMFYATGFMAPDPYIYFESGREKAIVVSTLEYNRALNETDKGVKVYARQDFSADGKDIANEKLIPMLMKHMKATHIETPFDFPLGYAEIIRQADVEISCASGLFFPERAIKNKNEISLIKKAMGITENAMLKAISIISDSKIGPGKRLIYGKEPLTSEILRYEIDADILKNGGKAEGTIVSCGKASSEPHNRGTGYIFAGKTIIIDIFPSDCKSGYYGDLTRTFVKGVPETDLIKKAFEAVKEARDKSEEKIHAGIKASDIHKTAHDILEKRGFFTGRAKGKDCGFIHSLGHGLGMEVHEYPRLSSMNSKPLEKGNVVTVEPGVYYPEWGGVRLEDVVAVEKSSCKILTAIDTFLVID